MAFSPVGSGELRAAAPVRAGYVEIESIVVGTANIYTGSATSPAQPTGDQCRYATRFVGRFPEDPACFSGRVFLETFNTTRGGVDHDRVWRQLEPLIARQGDGWIGVTVRPSASQALKAFDAGRYGGLDVPVNDVEWDILRHLGALLRTESIIKGHHPAQRLYLTGYSQSGVDTATFSMAFHESTRLRDGQPFYDGYFPSAHSGTLASVHTGAASLLPPFEHVPMTAVAVPVVDLETQTDVEGVTFTDPRGTVHTSTGGAYVRRPDSDRPGDLYRLYEVAGAPHIGSDPQCSASSGFPTDPFVRAAALRLIRWAEEGIVPPERPRLALAELGAFSSAEVDEFGNAMGGLRSPYVDIPLSTYKVRAGPTAGGLHMLVGDEIPFTPGQARGLYRDAATYISRFTRSLDEAIRTGDLLAIDRDGLLERQLLVAANAFR
ncbi:MAG: alpha/beta hydrolase domain-containing protein [Actinomycetota bacterium]|nr:alpha/beta hydrolase domain-containing protein [Actinomycetota bacterium]